MKVKVSPLYILVGMIGSLPCAAVGATIASFDGGNDSIHSLEQRGAGAAPTVEPADGNPGGFLQVTQNANDSHNFVTFDQTDVGTFPASMFRFDFRNDFLGAGGADGISFSYLDTSIFGTTGALTLVPFTAEDPASFGVLGFGFDTWGNGGANDANANGANYSEITLFFNGIIAARIDDTRALPTPLDLKDGAWHTVTGGVDFQNSQVFLSVDGNPIFSGVVVDELAPFESRIAFAGRTGNANERAAIDNVNVQWGTVVPEPSSGLFLGLGALLLLRSSRIRNRVFRTKTLLCAGATQVLAGSASAATILTFEGGVDSPYNLQQFGTLPAPTVLTTGGNPGGYLRLTANIGSQNNVVTVDQTDPGFFPAAAFSFQFRLDLLGNGGADGFSFTFLDTALYGASGPVGSALFTAEDPAVAGALGFGFDTWGNGGAFDSNANGQDYSEITLFSNGTLVSRIDDTRLLPTSLNLKDSAWHTVNGVVDFQNAKVSLNVDGNPIFEGVDVPDLVPFESRVMFAGRTGDANERAAIDNVNVQYVPEPGTIGLLAAGLLGLRRHARAVRSR